MQRMQNTDNTENRGIQIKTYRLTNKENLERQTYRNYSLTVIKNTETYRYRKYRSIDKYRAYMEIDRYRKYRGHRSKRSHSTFTFLVFFQKSISTDCYAHSRPLAAAIISASTDFSQRLLLSRARDNAVVLSINKGADTTRNI